MYYGSDSYSTAPTQDFYIGKMGSHLDTTWSLGSGDIFNQDACKPGTKVYGYWWLGGPGTDPAWSPGTYTLDMALTWGQRQATSGALAAASGQLASANGKLYSDYLTQQTMFADIETGGTVEPNLWLTPTDSYPGGTGLQFNGNVVVGFLQAIQNAGRPYGLYSAAYSEWEVIFGSASYSLGWAGIIGWAVSGDEFGQIPVIINQYETSPADLDKADTLPS